MATGEENVSEDLKKLMLDLKKAAAKLHTLFDCYDPNIYPANVLRTNKENWMKKIDEAMTSVTEACLEFQFLDDADVPEQIERATLIARIFSKIPRLSLSNSSLTSTSRFLPSSTLVTMTLEGMAQ